MATVAAQIQNVYIGLLGRAADKAGLDYWTDEIESGALTLEQLRANIVEEQDEYKDGIGTMTRAQAVNALYENLFNRAAEEDGLDYWVNGGGAEVSFDQLVLALVDGAAAADTLVLDNKTEVALYYTEQSGDNYVPAEAAGVIADVDGTRASVTQAKQAVDNGDIDAPEENEGQTFTLTANTDVLTPNQSDSTMQTTDGDDTIRGDIAANDLATADTIDGGAGFDTLNALLDGTAGGITTQPVLDNVERINVETVSNAAILNLSDADGVEQVWHNATANSVAFTANNIDLSTTVGLTGDFTAGTTVTTGFAFANVAGSDDTASVALQEANVGNTETVAIAGVENLNIAVSDDESTNTNVSTISALDVADTENVTVTGEVDTLTVGDGGNSDFSALEKFDASGLEGNLVLDLDTGTSPAQGVTVLASSNGTNTVTLDSTGTNGDVIEFNSSNVSTINNLTTITNFNEGTGANGAGNEDKIDVSAFDLGSDTTVGTTAVTPAGDIAGFFSGTDRIMVDDTNDRIYVDSDKNGNFDAGSDLAVEFTALTGANIDIGDFTIA